MAQTLLDQDAVFVKGNRITTNSVGQTQENISVDTCGY